MNPNHPELPQSEFSRWFNESLLAKLLMIGILSLLLLIPSNWIQNMILERQARQMEVGTEIADKWGGKQLVDGPILILPYKQLKRENDKNGKPVYSEHVTTICVLPETLNMATDAKPETRHRGIFETVVYDTRINIHGKFSALELNKSGINPDHVLWAQAKVAIGISDINGLKNNPAIKLGDSTYTVEPDFTGLKLFQNNLVALPDLSVSKSSGISFNVDLDLRGSSELSFRHLGKTTVTKVTGNWDDPSFIGRYLPEEPQIADGNFSATWKMPYFNRTRPQQWIADDITFNANDDNAVFGVKFVLPVDQYQKTMRTAKYAILIILLTFISLVFTEFLNKRKVHMLQYVLIGASMTIYYSLLLSFSEQIGFNKAYLLASVATIALIGTFIASILKSRKPALLFSAILGIFYGFIFVIIQLQDLALLFGSVGLFVIVAGLMYLSQRIHWEKRGVAEPSEL